MFLLKIFICRKILASFKLSLRIRKFQIVIISLQNWWLKWQIISNMFRSPWLYIFVYIHEAHTRCRFHSVLHTSHRARTILFEGHWWLNRFRDLVFCSSFLIECAVYNLDMKCNIILLRYFDLYKKLIIISMINNFYLRHEKNTSLRQVLY